MSTTEVSAQQALLPCPNGHKVDRDEHPYPVNRDRDLWEISCEDPACGWHLSAPSYDAVIAEWNTRTFIQSAHRGGEVGEVGWQYRVRSSGKWVFTERFYEEWKWNGVEHRPLYTAPPSTATLRAELDAANATLERMHLQVERLNDGWKLAESQLAEKVRECEGLGAKVADLLWRIVANARGNAIQRLKTAPLWSLVSAATGHGSTRSAEICRGAGFNPDSTSRKTDALAARGQEGEKNGRD